MATRDGDPEQYDAARIRCRPCHGNGRVLSALGGAQHEVSCPWCAGSGLFIAGHDAQETPAESPS
jgi:DnaJ-class molecular chaperone